jgi:crotonobetainyl-CoA:carnitine CoA-transferase CaiB-like acyl-CoA transferase
MLSVVGVLLALLHRQRTGEGQELWTSLHDGGLVFSSDVWLGPDGEPWDRPHLDAGQHGVSPLYRLYRTQAGGWICIAAEREDHRRALCRAMGVTDGDDLERDLERAFLGRTALAWSRQLDAAGVPNEIPIDTVEGHSVLHDDDNVRLGLVAEYEHPVLGRLRQFGTLINFDRTPGRIGGPPPLVGQHSREILRDAGLRDGDIDSLVAAGTVYEPDEHYADRFHN